MEEEVLFEIEARTNPGTKLIHNVSKHYIGKLVLTTKRIMFLSSGKSGASGVWGTALFLGPIVAALTDESRVKRIATEVDLSALSNEGSWEYELSERYASCGVGGSIWTVPFLRITGTDSDGQKQDHVVFRRALKKKVFADLALRLEDASRLARCPSRKPHLDVNE